MSSPPTLRLATVDDLDRMSFVMRAAMLQLSAGFYTDKQAESASKFLCVPDPMLILDGTSYVIEYGGDLIAVGAWSTRQKLFTGSEDQELLTERVIPGLDSARLRAFFVAPAHTNQGLGRLLYKTCHRAAFSMGYTDFELVATLPGVPFYERLGFEGMGSVEIDLPDGTLLPCVPMSRSIL